MSASNHDAGMSLAARTAAAATAAAKQLGSVLGLTRQSPPPSQAPPSPPTSIGAALSVEGLTGVLEELRIAEERKKDKDCEREEEDATTVKDGGSGPVEVGPAEGRVREEKQKKARKGKGNKANPFPQKPGEPDCAFYIRTGKCDYGQNCKFNHPPDRWKRNKAQRQGTPASDQASNVKAEEDRECQQVETRKCKYFASPQGCKYGNVCIYSHYIEKVEAEIELNFLGLPIRPGEKECPLYMETGACKDSTNCKYHHPNPTAFDDRDQPSEFSSSSTSLLPDFGNVSWVSESTSYGVHLYMGDSLPYMQGMPAMHQVLPLNNDWRIYQASIDPHLNHGIGQNLVAATEDDTKHNVNGKDYPGATNDFKGNEKVTPVSTYSTMTEGNDGGKHLPAAATSAINVGASSKHLPVFNANNATAKKGSQNYTPVGRVNGTSTGKGTGKMSTGPFVSVPLEATKGKKKQKQPLYANPHVTKSSGTGKHVSIPNNVPKEQGKNQPPVSNHYEDTEGTGSKNETTFHYISKGMGGGKKPQLGINYDGTKEKEYEKLPIKGKGNGSNHAKTCSKEPTKSKKNEKHSPVASAHYAPKGKAKEEQHPVSADHDCSDSKGNGSYPTKISANESQPTKSKKNEKHSSVASAHHVPQGKAKEEQHPVSTHHDDSDNKRNESSLTRDSGNESQPTKNKNEKHSPVLSVHYVPKGKAKEVQHQVDYEDSDGKVSNSNLPENSGNESQPAKSKKNEKHSAVAGAQYVPKARANVEQHPVFADHDDSDGKGNGNQISVDTPMISVSARKKGKQPSVAISHDSTNAYMCGKDSLLDVPASNTVINDWVSGKAPDDVILLDATQKTEGSKCKPPTQLTELPRRPGQPECPFYMNKGGCKYKLCKFDHPKDQNQIQSSCKCLLSAKGLPLRPGLPICARYSQSGICTYGPVCRYDHPVDVTPSQTVAK